jgi:DNA-binding transcriptional LysR family regulator
MNLRHIKYFIAVAETLNFRRAAERLHLAQPALSRQIKDLEDEIGTRLFHRNTSGTTLTEAGTVLLEEARDILERVDMAVELTQSAAAGRKGHLRIAGITGLSVCLLSDALASFQKEYPHVEITLHDIKHRDLFAELKMGHIHLGFAIGPPASIPDEFEHVFVGESILHLAVSRNHPLVDRKVIHLEEICDDNILSIGEINTDDLHQRVISSILDKRNIAHHPNKYI